MTASRALILTLLVLLFIAGTHSAGAIHDPGGVGERLAQTRAWLEKNGRMAI